MKFFQKIFDSYDPMRYAFLYCMFCIIPSLISLFFYLYFRDPGGLICLMIPTIILPAALASLAYKKRAVIILLASLLIAVEMIIIDKFTAIPLVMFILSFLFIFILFKFRALSSLVSVSIILGILPAVHPTSYDADNQIIAYFFVFVIMIVWVFMFEILFTKYELRQTLRYQIELVNDLFKLCLKNKSDTLKYKCLLSENYLYRTNILANKVFKDEIDMFFHKVSRAMSKIETIIDPSRFSFRSTKMYAHKARRYYESYRKFYRSVYFLKVSTDIDVDSINLAELNEYKDSIIKFLSYSYEVLINKEFNPAKEVISNLYIRNAVSSIDKFLQEHDAMEEKTIYYLFGIKYSLEGILNLKNKLMNGPSHE